MEYSVRGRFFEALAFGDSAFLAGEEHREFQYKFLIVVMLSAAILTALLLLSSVTGTNTIDDRHVLSMGVFTGLSVCLWWVLRGSHERFSAVAWAYEILCFLEYISVTLFVPLDELRVFWFATNVPGVFILLGRVAGWMIAVLSVATVIASNSFVDAPYSINALATFSLGLLFFAFFFHYYVSRSMSYYERMSEAITTLAHQASHDPLTGVINARMYYETCNRMISNAIRSDEPFAVLFVDLDHFKVINDTLGHSAGDAVLKAVASCLLGNLRAGDVLGRIGGEEFSVFLPNTALASAMGVGEKLRKMVETLAIHEAGQQIRVTASIGVAGRQEGIGTIETIQHNADQAMYKAKAGGRNRVSAF